MPPTTTMKRIAGELGVSITTVSKVLNNRDDIGHATRARVLAKVAELGYQPNAVARSLTLRRTHTLGVVIPDLMHSFFVEIVAGLEMVASARGYGLLLCSSNEDPLKERQELEMLRQRQVDGIVLGSANASGNTDLLQQLTVARHRPRHDRPRRSSRRPLRPRRHRRRGGRPAGDGAPASRGDGGRSRTSPAPRSSTPSGARRATASRSRPPGSSRSPSGSSAAGSRKPTATARRRSSSRCSRGSTACSRRTIRPRSAR